jgi:hypothetical protein
MLITLNTCVSFSNKPEQNDIPGATMLGGFDMQGFADRLPGRLCFFDTPDGSRCVWLESPDVRPGSELNLEDVAVGLGGELQYSDNSDGSRAYWIETGPRRQT